MYGPQEFSDGVDQGVEVAIKREPKWVYELIEPAPLAKSPTKASAKGPATAASSDEGEVRLLMGHDGVLRLVEQRAGEQQEALLWTGAVRCPPGAEGASLEFQALTINPATNKAALRCGDGVLTDIA